MDKITNVWTIEYCLSEECGSMASAINGKCHKYDKCRKGEERTWNCKIHHKVMNSSMVPKWYTGMSHRLHTGVWYPVDTQGCCTDCKQEYSTQLVCRNIAQVVSRK